MRLLQRTTKADDAMCAYTFRQFERWYSEPQRHYHTLAHISQCLSVLEPFRPYCENQDAVELALWFHDSVYDVQASDNEKKSANRAIEILGFLGADPELCQKVSELVLATQHTGEFSEPTNMDTAILLDIDLAILGCPPPYFDGYEYRIRREYAWVPDDAFIFHRTQLLEKFLARPHIFHTSPMREGFETHARNNLRRSVNRLKTGLIL